MPHVIVKLWPGKSDAQKQQLADDVPAGSYPHPGVWPGACVGRLK